MVAGGGGMQVDPDVSGKVSVSLQKVPWDEAFESLLQEHGLTYKIEGKTIMSRKDAFPVRSDSKATFTVVAMGAEIDITIQIVVERAAVKPAKAEAPADPKPATSSA